MFPDMDSVTGTRVEDPLATLVGVLLLATGAVGASMTQRRLETEGRARTAPLFLIPFGVLMGAGAAMARGWNLYAAIAVGAVLVPVVGVMGRRLEIRRHGRGGRT